MKINANQSGEIAATAGKLLGVTAAMQTGVKERAEAVVLIEMRNELGDDILAAEPKTTQEGAALLLRVIDCVLPRLRKMVNP